MKTVLSSHLVTFRLLNAAHYQRFPKLKLWNLRALILSISCFGKIGRWVTGWIERYCVTSLTQHAPQEVSSGLIDLLLLQCYLHLQDIDRRSRALR